MKRHFLTGIVFLIIITAMTFPLVLNMTKYFPGFFSTDESYASLWDSWRIKHSFQYGTSLKNTDLIAYPFGLNLYASGYLSFFWLGLIYFLSIFTNPIFAYNIQILCNLFLSCFFAYFLTFYLTKNRPSAFFSGIIFAFCPYQFARIWQHLGLTFNEWIPLGLLSAILLKEHASKKSAFLFLFSLLLLFSFDWCIMYLSTIAIITFLIYVLLYNWKLKLFRQRQLLGPDRDYFKKVIFLGLIIFIVLLPQFFGVIKNRLLVSPSEASTFNPFRRPFEDLFAQSAKPLSYFLPAVVHPIFGKFTEQFVGSSLYGISFTEHTLYLGWIPFILAFVAIRKWRKMRKVGAVPEGDCPYPKEDFYIGFFIFLAVVAWLFSQPPWWNIFGFKIYMPSFFMYKILPMYRAYCRFGIVVMLAVAVLAGFGLKFILERFKSQRVRLVLTCLFSGLVLFEFWNWPPYKVIDVSKVSAVYYWLKAQPEDIVIGEYPLDADSSNEMYKFYQTAHQKKMINGTIPGTPANAFAQTIVKLSEPKTAAALKGMGVKYVLVHRQDYIDTGLVDDTEELNKIPQNSGLKFIKTFPAQECPQKDIMCVQKSGPIDVYEVVASAIKPEVQ